MFFINRDAHSEDLRKQEVLKTVCPMLSHILSFALSCYLFYKYQSNLPFSKKYLLQYGHIR